MSEIDDKIRYLNKQAKMYEEWVENINFDEDDDEIVEYYKEKITTDKSIEEF